MSKRLAKGMIRSTTPTGAVLNLPGPITKGQALIKARNILGPLANVGTGKYIQGLCQIEIHGREGITIICSAPTWEIALAAAGDSAEAREWSDAQIDEGNRIEAALDSLKKTRKKIAETNFKQFMQGLVERAQRQEEDKRKNAENYELWKEARAEETVTAIARSRARAMIGPHVQFLELANLKALAKAERVREYDQAHQGF